VGLLVLCIDEVDINVLGFRDDATRAGISSI
jgi:hypothetical protein